ncbi:MAG: hypothetical protein V9H25_12380 [Candidatus Competibacter sp.]
MDDSESQLPILAGLTNTGGIYYSTNLATWTNIPGRLNKLVAGDFNGDGKADLAGLTTAGQHILLHQPRHLDQHPRHPRPTGRWRLQRRRQGRSRRTHHRRRHLLL